MVLNNKGQVYLVSIMIATIFIVFALAVAPTIKQFVDDARNPSTDSSVGLDCSNTSISKYDKATCIAVDTFNPYFVGFLVFAAGLIITAKIIVGGA